MVVIVGCEFEDAVCPPSNEPQNHGREEADDRFRPATSCAAPGTLPEEERTEPRRALLAVHHGEARIRARPFDAIELELAVLWAR